MEARLTNEKVGPLDLEITFVALDQPLLEYLNLWLESWVCALGVLIGGGSSLVCV